MTDSIYLYIFVILSIACSCTSQVFQKYASRDLHHPNESFLKLFLKFNTLLSIFFLGLGLIFWLLVISQMELSLAYPLLSIGYVVMLIISRYLFKETISLRRWLGTGFIILGVISMTGVRV